LRLFAFFAFFKFRIEVIAAVESLVLKSRFLMSYAQHLSKSLLAFMLFLMASPAAIDQSLAQEKKRPRLSVDLAQFLGDSTHTKLEVYQGIDRSGLVYQKANQVFVASFSKRFWSPIRSITKTKLNVVNSLFSQRPFCWNLEVIES
jgi:hypothetical protein